MVVGGPKGIRANHGNGNGLAKLHLVSVMVLLGCSVPLVSQKDWEVS